MKPAKLKRDKVTALITREVRRLVKEDDAETLGDLLTDGLSWLSNSHHHTAKDLGAAVLALLPLGDVGAVEHVADTIIWSREMRGHNWRNGARRGAASATARRILAPLGVRYAACGCLKQYAGDNCCDAAQATRRAS